jgi:hypothetical protein
VSALLRDFKHGIRALRRSRGFTLLAVSTLALFGVEAHDPAIFAAAGLVLASAALIAWLHPAVRATRVDPMEAIRVE